MIKKKPTPPLNRDALQQAAECLRILAHPSRLEIVQLLLTGETHSVNEIADACGLSQPATSDHLRLMQRCGFLESRREGRTVFYKVSEPHLQELMACMQNRFGAA